MNLIYRQIVSGDYQIGFLLKMPITTTETSCSLCAGRQICLFFLASTQATESCKHQQLRTYVSSEEEELLYPNRPDMI